MIMNIMKIGAVTFELDLQTSSGKRIMKKKSTQIVK
jgi:hypothetical protein